MLTYNLEHTESLPGASDPMTLMVKVTCLKKVKPERDRDLRVGWTEFDQIIQKDGLYYVVEKVTLRFSISLLSPISG